MAVRLRLQRHGAKHAPVYRVVAADARSPRDGRFVEILGNYNPRGGTPELQLTLKGARIDYWLGVGAKPSETVHSLILRAKREGCYMPELQAEPAEGLEAEAEGQEVATEVLDASQDSEEEDRESIEENSQEMTVESDAGAALEEQPVVTEDELEVVSSGQDQEVESVDSSDHLEAGEAIEESAGHSDEGRGGESDSPKTGAS